MIDNTQQGEIKKLVESHFKNLLKIATNKQIYQFANNPTPQLTDLVPQSNENNEAAPHQTVQSSWQQILDLFFSEMPGDSYIPEISVLSGGTYVDTYKAFYTASKLTPGGIVNGFVEFEIKSDTSNQLIYVSISAPTAANFSDQLQCGGDGSVIPTDTNTGAIGCGLVREVYSDSSSDIILVSIELAQTNYNAIIKLYFTYQIQPTPSLTLTARKK